MKLKITVHGIAYEVDVEVLDDEQEGYPSALPYVPSMPDTQTSSSIPSPLPRPNQKKQPKTAADASGSVTSPIAGIVLEIKCTAGGVVKEGDIVMILEAMKMKTSIAAPADGKVKTIPVAKGDNIREGQTLIEYE
ncbi:biotin/lipoyl attachment domain-containing protein [Denitrovibrio acetiphilus DSM 12809]|uniref:Biotin/lipoyl attachment domain-containing protein n=1 Tax=Denitrovibrio acetiphilus (strain DSM 12809 / NBRC 114555 / N2460) TaxID=522772 RepID=D4H0S7_DENA2|nr:biotin/lipoyl-containing protein [Denitrovibrio acetiphilus]ADD68590.1 biotin/lipoyl attachment domain-containing protein [Denitrovibrio acetiphilus DSM 12809]